MSRGRRTALLALCAAAVAVGCGGPPAMHYYVLEPTAAAAQRGTGATTPALGVRPFHVDPPYDQDRIVYRVGADSAEVGFYAYHRWAAPLSRMLPRVVAGALDGAPGIGAVEPALPGRGYPALLDGRVLALEEVDGAGGVTARAVILLVLRRPDGNELWSETLVGESTMTAGRVGDVVERIRAALDDAVRGARAPIAAALE